MILMTVIHSERERIVTVDATDIEGFVSLGSFVFFIRIYGGLSCGSHFGKPMQIGLFLVRHSFICVILAAKNSIKSIYLPLYYTSLLEIF